MAVDKNGEYIDVSDIHFAVGVADSADGYSVPDPSVTAPTASVSQEPSTSTKTRYYSGKARYVSTKEGETKVVLTISGLATQDEALVVGKGYDAATHMLVDTGRTTQVYSALSFKTQVEGGYKYFQYLKGSVAPFKQEAQTSTNDVNEKTTELTYTALSTIFEGFKVPKAGGAGYEAGPCKRIVADTREDADVTDATWFAEVQKPDLYSAPSALSFTAVPINGATSVLATVHPAITFNNEIASQHVFLINDTTDAAVTATVALDTTSKIITITPAASLTAGSKFAIVLAGVTDVYGQALTNQAIYFTVAS